MTLPSGLSSAVHIYLTQTSYTDTARLRDSQIKLQSNATVNILLLPLLYRSLTDIVRRWKSQAGAKEHVGTLYDGLTDLTGCV